jgi:hypothetical protein
MSSQIAVVIDEIISKRKLSNSKPKNVYDVLNALYTKLKNLREVQIEIINSPTPSTSVQTIRQIDIDRLIELVGEQLRVWDAIYHRLDRDTINLGVIGLARQGKSTLLQKVSGLTDAEIPSNDRMPCTSVQSNICHHDGKTYAKIYFHSEESFLKQIIIPYYEELGFTNMPTTIDEFCRQPFPSNPINPRHPAKAEAIYKHLRDDYHACADGYRQLLQPQKRYISIQKDVIKEYVSQDYDINGRPRFFTHLAVEKVEIFSPFPELKVKKIGLVDMPGLGDTRLGDAQRMIAALSRDVDFILFVRRPNSSGDLWGNKDVDLYDEASQALRDSLPLKHWSLMLLNYDGNNELQCQDLQNTIESKGIHVRSCIKGNCKNPDEANKILGEVLQELVENMESLDRQYMSAAFSGLTELQRSIVLELQQAQQIVRELGDIDTQCIRLTQEFMKVLYSQIEDFRSRMRLELSHPGEEFKQQVDMAIQRCYQEVSIVDRPTLEMQAKERGVDGAYFDNIQEMRSSIMQQFHSIEDSLKKSVDRVKCELVDVLINLGLNKIIISKELDFIHGMNELLDRSQEFKSLAMAFEFIASFEITYKGFMQSRVWQEISKVLSPEPLKPVGTPVLSTDAVSNLEKRHKEAIQKSQAALMELGNYISMVQLSMIEEFADHLTRRRGVKQEWSIFLNKNRSLIWPELQKLEQEKQLQQRWLALIDDTLITCNNIKN